MQRPVEHLIDEVRLLYQSLVMIGDDLHAGSGISMGMRAVLEYLERHGACTVPAIARARRVSRQRIQTLVNPLLERGWAETVVNPASKRSPLIALTGSGSARIRAMRATEAQALAVPVDDAELQRAAETLAELRAALECGR